MVDNNAQSEKEKRIPKVQGDAAKGPNYPIERANPKAQDLGEDAASAKLSATLGEDPDDENQVSSSERQRRSPSRSSREVESREHTGNRDVREFTSNDSDTLLPTPPAREGYIQRWVREDVLNQKDGRNWSRKSRLGYRPRPLDSIDSTYHPPVDLVRGSEQVGNVLRSGEMILCEIPEKQYQANRDRVNAETDRRTDGIMSDLLAQNQPGAPMQISGKRDVRVSTRRVPRTAPDERT